DGYAGAIQTCEIGDAGDAERSGKGLDACDRRFGGGRSLIINAAGLGCHANLVKFANLHHFETPWIPPVARRENLKRNSALCQRLDAAQEPPACGTRYQIHKVAVTATAIAAKSA